MRKDKLAKYIHILWRNETKFNGALVDLIDNPQYEFNSDNHLFITPNQDVYDALSKYKNVVLDKKKENLFNRYAGRCDWIISHSNLSIKDFLFAKRSSLNNIIYRYWGGGIAGFKTSQAFSAKNFLKIVLNIWYRHKIKQLAAIGIANVVDTIDIRKTFKNIPLYLFPYATADSYNDLLTVKNIPGQQNECLNVLLGHRGTRENNHIQILDKLSAYSKEKMRIYIPLSYGDQDYITEVKGWVANNKKENVIIVDDFMSYKDYAAFLNSMDIAIFDGKESYALGNVSILLFFEKKFYFNQNGVIKEAFETEGIPCEVIDNIGVQDFDKFSQGTTYQGVTTDKLIPHNFEYSLSILRTIFRDYN